MNDAEQFQAIFFPYTVSRVLEVKSKSIRFVHYTTAAAAVSMLEKQEVWMRKSNIMNDFMEIDHGLECLSYAYRSECGDEFKAFLNSIYPDISNDIESHFDGWLPQFKLATYITSVSEHDDSEDHLGRLSMWRAYGSEVGVAVVLRREPFEVAAEPLHAFTSPVAYFTKERFLQEFNSVKSAMIANKKLIEQVGRDAILAYVFEAFRFSVLCTKHPGFQEEREWRIIHTPTYQPSRFIERSTETVRGVPQPVYKLPLKKIPEADFDSSPNSIIDRLIIGPTQFPLAVKEALIDVLTSCGVEDAPKKVVCSTIPLR